MPPRFLFLLPWRSPAPGARCLPVLLAALLVLLAPARLPAANALEYQVKAGFLFNFAKFVEWPAGTLPPGAGLRLGIVASDEVYALMEKSLAGKAVGDHLLRVERLDPAQLARGAALPQIVFIHQDHESGLTAEQLAAFAGRPAVLLVGESAGFATTGGMIGFVQRGENLRFQVNLASAQRAGLKLSARLSGLAEMVTSSPP